MGAFVATTGTANSDANPPTAAPTPGLRIGARVEIVYDWYPEETAWSLVDQATGTEIYSSAAYSVLTPMQPVVTDIPGLLPGRTYTLSITDVARDGLCCRYGEGSAKLAVLWQDGTEGPILWTSNGSFGAQEVASVTLPQV